MIMIIIMLLVEYLVLEFVSKLFVWTSMTIIIVVLIWSSNMMMTYKLYQYIIQTRTVPEI